MIIGRKEEIAELRRAYESEYSQFVAVYGRRRIGKTFLVREVFDYKFTFSYTGRYALDMASQLAEFHAALIAQGAPDAPMPGNWSEAFRLLGRLIDSSADRRKVIFIDELPWMDSPRSGFVSAFEGFWNGWASARRDVLLIVCGSASSWIIDNIFRNKGGLYNRVSYRIHLGQFSLRECEEYADYLRLGMSRNQILEGYMVMGGVPYYWSKLQLDRSLAQNINALFFDAHGIFRYEFNNLYRSIFNNPDKYLQVINALASKKKGLTREELLQLTGLESNGAFSTLLENLVECGFIRRYIDTTKKLRDATYQLIDCYTLFYYHFQQYADGVDSDYWLKLQSTPAYHTWCGLAFERVCMLHVDQLKHAMGISGIMANVYSWHCRATEEHPGVQIDLLIDRADNVVSVCEMKYAPDGYRATAAASKSLSTKMAVLRSYLPARKAVQPVLITSNGLIRSKNDLTYVGEITADQLF